MKAMFRDQSTLAPPITEPVEAQGGGQVKGQVGQVEGQVEGQESLLPLSDIETAIIEACKEEPRTGRELLAIAGYSSRTGHFARTLNRLLALKLIDMTIPGKPRSSKQKYRLTEKGRHTLH